MKGLLETEKWTVVYEWLRKVNINPCQLVKLIYRCQKKKNTNSLSSKGKNLLIKYSNRQQTTKIMRQESCFYYENNKYKYS